MPYHLELGSDGRPFPAGKAIVVDTKGRHYSQEPIPVERAKKQKKALELSKLRKEGKIPERK